MRRRHLLITTLAILAALLNSDYPHVGLGSVQVTRVAAPSYTIAAESGQRRNSLFEPSANSEVIPVGRWIVSPSLRPNSCASKQTSWYIPAARLFRIGTVYAIECTASSCGGSYMTSGPWSCPASCGSEYERFYSDPFAGCPRCGWEYTGDGTCPADDGSGTCRCLEGACQF